MPDQINRGGLIPGPLVRVNLHPAECVLRPGPDGGWECVRADHDHSATPPAEMRETP